MVTTSCASRSSISPVIWFFLVSRSSISAFALSSCALVSACAACCCCNCSCFEALTVITWAALTITAKLKARNFFLILSLPNWFVVCRFLCFRFPCFLEIQLFCNNFEIFFPILLHNITIHKWMQGKISRLFVNNSWTVTIHVILPSVHSHNSICIDPARKAHRRQGLKSPLRRISHRVPGTDPL